MNSSPALCAVCWDNPVEETCKICKPFACFRCVEKFNESSQELHLTCMTCKANISYLMPLLSNKFQLAYKGVIKKNLLALETAKIPSTILKMARDKIKRQIDPIERQLFNIQYQQNQLMRLMEYKTCHKKLDKYAADIKTLTIRIEDVESSKPYQRLMQKIQAINDRDEFKRITQQLANLGKEETNANIELAKFRDELRKYGKKVQETSVPVVKLKYHCPLEGCRGFLDDQYKCLVCLKNICEHCFEECAAKTATDVKTALEAVHVCSEEAKKTIKMLRLDTKPCPKCSEMIHRSEGCPQMFCVKCGTAFDWNNMKIVHDGVIHNPHAHEFFNRNPKMREEYLRRQAVRREVDCGEVIPRWLDESRVSRNLGIAMHDPCIHIKSIRSIHLACLHFINFEVEEYNRSKRQDKNFDMRCRYITKDITEKLFQTNILRRLKQQKFTDDLFEITLNTATIVGMQLFNYSTIDTMDKLEQFVNIITSIFVDANHMIKDLLQRNDYKDDQAAYFFKVDYILNNISRSKFDHRYPENFFPRI